PNLVQREERAGQVERKTAPGVPRRVQDPRARQPGLPGTAVRRRGQELDQRGQAPGDTRWLHRAHHDPVSIDRQRVPFVGSAAGGPPGASAATSWMLTDGPPGPGPPGMGGPRPPGRGATSAQNRPTVAATPGSVSPTAVPGRNANSCPPPTSNRTGTGMTAWLIGSRP